jgi:hypothetical protein
MPLLRLRWDALRSHAFEGLGLRIQPGFYCGEEAPLRLFIAVRFVVALRVACHESICIMPRLFPIINVSAFPSNERECAAALYRLFAALSHYTHSFEYALRLFEYSESELSKMLSPIPQMKDQEARFMFAGWMHIAARDATMSLYHFAKTIEEIRDSFRYLPTLRLLVRHDIIRISVKLFDAQFPNYLKMRHSVAHSAEFASIKARKQNATRTVSMRENLLGRQFTSSINGRLISTDITALTLTRLVNIETRFFSAFAEAHDLIKDLSRLGQ